MKIIALVYFVAITAAETITVDPNHYLDNPVYGLVLHLTVMIIAIAHSAVGRLSPVNRQFVLSLSLVPLVRVLSLSMPLTNLPQIAWHPIIYAPLAAATVVVIRLEEFKLPSIGFKITAPRFQLLVTLSGFGLGLLEYVILRPKPYVPTFTPDQIIPATLVFFVFVGFVEEFIFRGVLQRTGKAALGAPGILLVAALFAILHMGFYSWLDVLFVFGVALYFAWVVNRTGSLLGVVLAHGITNTMLYLVLPFFL